MKPFGYIYQVTNLVNGKVYIGQTVHSIERRFAAHINNAQGGKATALCHAIRKYGAANFSLGLLATCASLDEMNGSEIKYIDQYDSYRNGYNMTMGGDGSPGLEHSEESKAIRSQRMKGNKHLLGYKHSDESKAKIGAGLKGNTHLRGHKYSNEHCEAISVRQRGEKNHFYGKKHSKETKAKIAVAATGREVSEETRMKLSRLHTGRVVSAEARKKMSEWQLGEKSYMYGKTVPQETRDKISNSLKGEKCFWHGKKRSPETRKKISEKLRGRKLSLEHREAISLGLRRVLNG
ncbi:hypothetical protein LCGC14_0659180 [marine sediment metagenome]|uniref:GIY-YIG domain-containing protein n=1 Tax=marine sediment metagenome TaxID=412755 RepID=A0A0F9RE08_9ZZZZ